METEIQTMSEESEDEMDISDGWVPTEEEMAAMQAEIDEERNREYYDEETEYHIANGEVQCEGCCEWFDEDKLETVVADEYEEYKLCKDCAQKQKEPSE